jgi:hypothetical protein
MEAHLLAEGRRGGRREHAARMLTVLHESISRSEMAGHPLFFMFFSAGAYVWAEIIDLIAPGAEFASLGDQLSGVMFDSAPVYPCIQSIVNAHADAFGMSRWLKTTTRVVFTVWIYLRYTRHLLMFMSLANTDGEIFWRRMSEAPPRRELYLYSDNDGMTDHVKQTELIGIREEAGAEVTAVKFEASEHVLHLVHAPTKYKDALMNFMDL